MSKFGAGMKMAEATIDCLSLFFHRSDLLKPSVEREPESALLLNNKLVHPQPVYTWTLARFLHLAS